LSQELADLIHTIITITNTDEIWIDLQHEDISQKIYKPNALITKTSDPLIIDKSKTWLPIIDDEERPDEQSAPKLDDCKNHKHHKDVLRKLHGKTWPPVTNDEGHSDEQSAPKPDDCKNHEYHKDVLRKPHGNLVNHLQSEPANLEYNT